MHSESEIEHTGIVCEIGQDSIKVRITAHTACAGCHASDLCSASGSVEKFFTLPIQDDIMNGQQVKIITSLSTGFRALKFGYLLPLLVMVASLVLLLLSGLNEVWAGIGSLGFVVVYYLLLYRFRGRIEKTINFTLKPA
jgi:sigma-E factor negative regulatory protein RseC